MNTTIDRTDRTNAYDVEPTVQCAWRDRIAMPSAGSRLAAELRVAAPGVPSVQDTCALMGPIDGSHAVLGQRVATTDAGTVDFAGTPAWSPPI